jgi:CBS domain-containing protein
MSHHTAIARNGGSYLTPSFDHASVSDAMRPGVITCAPDASMEDVARAMATNHVHAVVVRGIGDGAPWGVVTDLDVLAVAQDAPDRLAGSCASEDLLTVAPDDRLADAARRMREHGAAHALVVDREHRQPVGVLSTLDLAGVVAWARG